MSDAQLESDVRADIDRPEERASADVTLVARGITMTVSVEVSESWLVVVRPDGRRTRPGRPRSGWVTPSSCTGSAARRSGRSTAWSPGWRARGRRGSTVAPGGQRAGQRSQRRKAVRARVQFPCIIPWAGRQMTGNTVDISEAGIRALMDGWGVPLDPGTAAQLSLDLDDVLLHLHRRGRVDLRPRRPVADGDEVRTTSPSRPATPPPAGVQGPARRAGAGARLSSAPLRNPFRRRRLFGRKQVPASGGSPPCPPSSTPI